MFDSNPARSLRVVRAHVDTILVMSAASLLVSGRQGRKVLGSEQARATTAWRVFDFQKPLAAGLRLTYIPAILKEKLSIDDPRMLLQPFA